MGLSFLTLKPLQIKLIKKYTPVILNNKYVNDSVDVDLTFGHSTFNDSPRKEFDTEDEAIEHAFKENPWENWVIVPLIKFDNF